MQANDERERVRLDKWLWAARFFKTRGLATEAVAGGKVEVNGERAKPARAVRLSDEIRIHVGPYEHVLIVRGLAERRGPASVARQLYDETDESRAGREKLAQQLRMAPAPYYEDAGRPTKKDRRALSRFSDRHRRG